MRHQTRSIVGSVIACAAIVGCTFATSSPSDTPLSSPIPVATDTPAASATPGAAPELGWTSAEIPGTVYGAAYDPDSRTWIAAGADSNGLAVWTSPNGMSWSRHGVPGVGGPTPPGGFQRATMGQVVRLGGVWYSLGIADGGGDYHQPLVWRSSDGVTFDPLTLSESFATRAYLIWGAASSLTTLVALGHGFGTSTGSTWVTHDGASWSESFPNGSGPSIASGIDLHDIVYYGGRFLAVGEAKAGSASTWLSADGLTWTASQDTPDLASSSMHAVEAAPGGGFAAVGVSKSGPAAWTSSDGVAWHRADITSPSEGAVPYSMVRLDTGLVALGIANGQTAVWTSATGAVWSAQTSALDGRIPDYIGYFGHDLAATDGRAILAFLRTGNTTTARMGAPALP